MGDSDELVRRCVWSSETKSVDRVSLARIRTETSAPPPPLLLSHLILHRLSVCVCVCAFSHLFVLSSACMNHVHACALFVFPVGCLNLSFESCRESVLSA